MLDVDLVLYGRQLHCLRWEGTIPNLEEEGEKEGITGYHGNYDIEVCEAHGAGREEGGGRREEGGREGEREEGGGREGGGREGGGRCNNMDMGRL